MLEYSDFDLDPRDTYTDEAKKELQRLMAAMDKLDNSEVLMLSMASLFDKLSRPNFPLTLKEEALRLTLNRRVYTRMVARSI